MRISERGLALIRESEGFSATVYLCPAGKPTIGYGHVVEDGEDFSAGGIRVDQAETLLIQDVAVAERAVSRLVTVEVSQNEFDALVVFAYNIGIHAFEKSTLLRFLNAGDKQAAAAQFGHWVYGGGVILAGLVNRRAAETALFNEDFSGIA
jgi:lysozyme